MEAPCENTILEEVLPKLQADYLVRITKTELKNEADIGKLNENVFLNIGLAEMNEGYLDNFKNIKIFNFCVSLILLWMSYSLIVLDVTTTTMIRRLSLLLVFYHQPLAYLSQGIFTDLRLVSCMLSWVFYTYLMYFWMTELHTQAFKTVNSG